MVGLAGIETAIAVSVHGDTLAVRFGVTTRKSTYGQYFSLADDGRRNAVAVLAVDNKGHCLLISKRVDVPLRLMVIQSILHGPVSGIELAQQQVEGAVIPLTHHLYPVSDEKCSTDSLTSLIPVLRADPVVDDLRTAGSTDVHEEGELNAILLCQCQHGSRGNKHAFGPVLAGLAENSSRAVEHIGSVASVNVRRQSWRAECEVLRAKRHHMDIGQSDQLFGVRIRSSV